MALTRRAHGNGASPLESTAFLAAIDFGGSKTALATADLAGTLLLQELLTNDPGQPADVVLGEALTSARALIQATVSSRGGCCAAVGVATPGIATASGTLLSPNLAGWDRVPLRDRVRRALGIEAVAVGNDVKCAALAELRWGALGGADPAVYLNLGTGVGAAVVVGGQIVHGAHGGAGEIGYATMAVGEEGPVLEDLVGGRGLARAASKLLGRPTTVEELFEATDEAASRLVEQALEGLAAYLSNIVLLLDPQRVVVGGGLMAAEARILPALRAGLRTPLPLVAEVVAARFPADASLRGAVALALDLALGDGARPAGSPQSANAGEPLGLGERAAR